MTIVGSGEQRRDFTHVKDVVQANMLAMQSENKEVIGEVFNVGTGKNHSVLEVSKLIGEESIHIAERPGEADNTLADISKINSMLGYEPTIKLEEWIASKK